MRALIVIVSHFVSCALLAYLANWVCLIPWRRSTEAHWTERARLLWPARLTAATNVFLIPAVMNEIHRFTQLQIYPHWSITLLAGMIGAILATYAIDRELFPEADFHDWLSQTFAQWGSRGVIWFAMILAIVIMPDDFGWPLIAVTIGYLVFHLGYVWGLAFWLLRRIGYLQPAGARLIRIVEQTSASMNVKPKRSFQCDGPFAQAYAFPTTRELLFSRRLLAICSDEEVAAICAHELGHLSESKSVLVARVLGSFIFVPLIFIHPVTSHSDFGLVPLLIAPSLLAILRNKFSQRMEKRADSIATAHATDGAVYASALEKIYRANHLPAVTPGKRQTHPHLYDRMLAAGITPSYPRPAAPSRMTLTLWFYAVLLVFFFILSAMYGG